MMRPAHGRSSTSGYHPRAELNEVRGTYANSGSGSRLTLDTGPAGESAAERVQAWVPNANVVKAFHTTGFNNMQNPVYGGAATVMFYAGNDASAKRVTHDLATTLGFDAFDAGNLVQARLLEQLAVLWISLAYGGGGGPALGREFAFRLVRGEVMLDEGRTRRG